MERNDICRELEEQVLILMQKEHHCLHEIQEYTREISDAMDLNDPSSIQMVLKLRGQVMTEVNKIRKQRELLLGAAGESRNRFQMFLSGQSLENMTEQEKRICSLAGSENEMMKKIVELDRKVSSRMAGVNSFYSR